MPNPRVLVLLLCLGACASVEESYVDPGLANFRVEELVELVGPPATAGQAIALAPMPGENNTISQELTVALAAAGYTVVDSGTDAPVLRYQVTNFRQGVLLRVTLPSRVSSRLVVNGRPGPVIVRDAS
ncbi:hypothetical protein UFOVP1244_15 [uncultured Caudovirales phage]|uniref:Uncharacterized protein n=1 Tax=uncultured Caudovirales phage TaxID=2100421 RepID=A0A6J5RFE3_9CAUD|nr:hypothetical protein UFOVP1244_15 [uncultured Caudovirales phage]